MFTVHPNPHHVLHPKLGWLHPDDAAALGLEVGNQLGKAGAFGHTCECRDKCPRDSNHPEANHGHHVEIDCTTGMVGYTRI